MSVLLRTFFMLGVFLGIPAVVGGAEPERSPRLTSGFVPLDPGAQVRRLGPGVNVIGYDPLWHDLAQARFRERHLIALHDAGFRSLRINLDAIPRLDAQLRLPATWLATLDQYVDLALAQDFSVILDLHEWNGVAKDPAGYRPKILACWQTLAERFKDAPNTVLFELLNEPNGTLDAAAWNGYFPEILRTVRATNPQRTVVVGPAGWNGIDQLAALELPAADRNLIATIHYYRPLAFTHQGAPWSNERDRSGVTWGTPAERQQVVDDFAGVAAWAQAQQRPILLGEFGAYDKGNPDLGSRAAYTAQVARTAEHYGWAWAYWQFDSDFILYDIDHDRWIEPLREALVPRSPQPAPGR